MMATRTPIPLVVVLVVVLVVDVFAAGGRPPSVG